ncbi:MAG: GTP-binding protein [Burkholderiales bacterium]|jgi:sulfate adenylyltransferase subunit 1
MSTPDLSSAAGALAGPARATAPVLRVMTAGSVDDGKSTLIGRLLHDLDRIDDDVLEDLRRASQRRGRGELDLSLFTDGLSDEREQGITIDVAYRYFAFGGRSFILADAPGHVEYTRNMVCAASQSDVALILVDARTGPLEQTRRHALLASLMGVPERIYLVNKMDLVGFDRARFTAAREAIEAIEAGIAAREGGAPGRVHVLPICALDGDHLARRGERMAWHEGPLLADLLLSLPARAALDGQAPLRFPVQGLIRPTGRAAQARWHDFRGLAGRIESGRLAVGDTLAVAEPSRGEPRSARVSAILLHEQERQQAQAGDSITLVLDADLDISRGAVLVHADQPATLSDRLEVDLCWMDERPGRPGQRLLVKQGTRTLAARIEALLGVVDVNTGQTEAVSDPANALRRNAVVRVRLHTERPLLADPYRRLPRTGSLILLEPGEFATLAAGVIRG